MMWFFGFSDVKIKLANRTAPGHRFVLTARADSWLNANQNWDDIIELGSFIFLSTFFHQIIVYCLNFPDWSHLDTETCDSLLHWIYKDELKVPNNNKLNFLINMLKAAGQYKLSDLICCCEQQLIPMADVTNCVELFVRAEETGAENLRKFCASLMSSHWVRKAF